MYACEWNYVDLYSAATLDNYIAERMPFPQSHGVTSPYANHHTGRLTGNPNVVVGSGHENQSSSGRPYY